jgi:hypothetical protein
MPVDLPPAHYSTIIGSYSTIIGSKVTCSEDYALCVGLRSTAATMHSDGSWTIDWPEIQRIAALDPDEQEKASRWTGSVVILARALLNGRGTIRQR